MIDRTTFREWLAAQPNRIFDSTQPPWPCNCPLAAYAQEYLHHPDAQMGASTLFHIKTGAGIKEPWFREFTRLVDMNLVNKQITAAKVIELLDTIP